MISKGATPLLYSTPGTAPLALRSQCDGTECRLTDCPQAPSWWGDCDHSQDVGVRCNSTHPRPGVS